MQDQRTFFAFSIHCGTLLLSGFPLPFLFLSSAFPLYFSFICNIVSTKGVGYYSSPPCRECVRYFPISANTPSRKCVYTQQNPRLLCNYQLHMWYGNWKLTFLVIMALGKFQGVIIPTTPMGWRMNIISLVGLGLWATWDKFPDKYHIFCAS